MTKMPCRITDEQVANPWDRIDNLDLKEITLDDLMSGEYELFIKPNDNYSYDLIIELISTGEVIYNMPINKLCAETLGDAFASYLNQLNDIQENEND